MICKPLFIIESKYSIDTNQEKIVLDKIKTILENILKIKISDFAKINNGQNINYKILINNKTKYLLRIITRKGYPSINTLNYCFELLNKKNISKSKIIYYDKSAEIVPYGFFVLDWINGKDASEKYYDNGILWIKDFANILNDVHTIDIPFFGYLQEGPKFETLKDYYFNIDKVIDTSFGQGFKDNYSIWELEKKEITSPNFLTNTFNKIKELALKINNPKSVLIHGDMLPENLIYTNQGAELIDWDESRANWWVYEIARTTYYIEANNLLEEFLKYYKYNTSTFKEIQIGIKIEHIRQLLRNMFMICFNNTNINDIKDKVNKIEYEIIQKFNI